MSLREAYFLYVERRIEGENVADGPLSAAGCMGYLAAAALMCFATTSG